MSGASEASPGRWARLTGLLVGEEDALGLALVRLLACATVAAHVGRFAATGAARFALLHRDRGGMSDAHGWLEPLGGAEPWMITLLCVVTCLAAILGAVGLFTRAALVVTWLGLRVISSLNPEAHGSYDGLLVDTLFILMLSGAGRALSLDAWRSGAPALAARWPRVLLVAQLGLLYLGSGLHKGSSGWVPGGDASALWYILQQPTWSRLGALPLALYPLTQVATTLVWFFEVLAPLFVVAVWLRESAPRGRALAALRRGLERVRFVEVYLAFGLAMHVGIEAMMEVGPFCFASLALYPAALAPARLRAWLERAAGWWRAVGARRQGESS